MSVTTAGLVGVVALVWIFAIAATVYVYRNDFARETIDVLYPAVGAILVSFYLGVKLVAVDQPPAKRVSTVVAVTLDSRTGVFTAMPVDRTRTPLPSLQGLQVIESVPYEDKIRDSNLYERLKSERDFARVGALVTDVVEFAVVKWFGDGKQCIGFIPFQTVELISAAAGGGTMPTNLIAVDVPPGNNELMKQHQRRISLPKGSTVTVIPTSRTIQIDTPNSVITLQVDQRAFRRLDPPVGVDEAHLYEAFGFEPGMVMFGFVVSMDFKQKPFARFSTQAKIEAEWADRIIREMDVDFSWERLRNMMLQHNRGA